MTNGGARYDVPCPGLRDRYAKALAPDRRDRRAPARLRKWIQEHRLPISADLAPAVMDRIGRVGGRRRRKQMRPHIPAACRKRRATIVVNNRLSKPQPHFGHDKNGISTVSNRLMLNDSILSGMVVQLTVALLQRVRKNFSNAHPSSFLKRFPAQGDGHSEPL
jgi:hypothetical protein